jgi:hypothetical protein
MVGAVEDRRGDQNLLPHPFRVRRQRLIAIVPDAEQLHEAFDLVGERLLIEVAQAADEAQVFRAGEIRVEVRLLGHVPELRLVAKDVGGDVGGVGPHMAGGLFEEAGQDPHRRALARAVRTEEAEDFAAANRERHVVDADDRAVAFGDPVDLQHGSANEPRLPPG